MSSRTGMAVAMTCGLLVVACGGPAPLPPEPMVGWQTKESAREFAELCRVHLGLELTERKSRDGIELCVPGERATVCKPVLIRFKRELRLSDEVLPEWQPPGGTEKRKELERLREERRIAGVVRDNTPSAEVLNVVVALKTLPAGKEARVKSILVTLVMTDGPDLGRREALCTQVQEQLVRFERLPEGDTLVVTHSAVNVAELRQALTATPTPIASVPEPATVPQSETVPEPETLAPQSTTVAREPVVADDAVAQLPRHLWPVYGVAVASLFGNIGFVLAWWRRRRGGRRRQFAGGA